ncbi:MAG: tRNA epoxyqueuosine(34) reductase QueG [Bacteroidetes bacterium]|nr:tRNA epoxyqueuosine(34) reductase QueG [Bacteroidota bacterium]
MSFAEKNAALVKAEAARLGFMDCRVARATRLDEDARKLEAWLQKGFHGAMSYMERNFDLRTDPSKLVPGARSVITLLINYFPSEKQQEAAPLISKYAWGLDYHDVIRPRLNALMDYIREHIGAVDGRGFVDSAPVLERSWAARSGLGWLGKNANLLNKSYGSFFFIATLITDLELEADAPMKTDHCGTCTRCIDACPTQAIVAPGEVDAQRCISYLTIELKDALMPSGFEHRADNWAFGCDVCQDVCPWNRFSKPHTEPAFKPIPEVLNLSTQEWLSLSEDAFRNYLKGSPIKRAKWAGMMRNLKAISASQ